MPRLYIIAGPNGAGKTTFAKEYLPKYAQCSNFVNADLIAMGLAPFSPAVVGLKAGRLLLEQINIFIKAKKDFAFESTLSGKTYVSLIERLKKQGYTITIFFLWIPAVSLAKERIKQRVVEGGHAVPWEDVKRRFERSRTNFIRLYLPLCDSWMLFDNSSLAPVEIVRFQNNKMKIVNKKFYHQFRTI